MTRRIWQVERSTGIGTGMGFATAGILLGVAIGVTLRSHQQHRYRRNLFSRSPRRRLAALGYLSGHPSAASAQLLRDYVRWEERPGLRRRGKAVLRHAEALLE